MAEPTHDNEGLHVTNPYTMRTFSGKLIDPFAMTAKDVDLLDIAHSLSRQCRFNGHTQGHLSVARHSINVADWVERNGGTTDEIIAAILHDAAEAYIGDLIRPLKKRPEFEFFRQLDDTITGVILFAADSPFTSLPAIVHEADNAVTKYEVELMRYDYDSTPDRDKAQFYKVVVSLMNIRHVQRAKAAQEGQ